MVFFPPPPFGVVAVQPTQSSPTPLPPVPIPPPSLPWGSVQVSKSPDFHHCPPFSFLHWGSLFLQSMRYVRVNKMTWPTNRWPTFLQSVPPEKKCRWKKKKKIENMLLPTEPANFVSWRLWSTGDWLANVPRWYVFFLFYFVSQHWLIISNEIPSLSTMKHSPLKSTHTQIERIELTSSKLLGSAARSVQVERQLILEIFVVFTAHACVIRSCYFQGRQRGFTKWLSNIFPGTGVADDKFLPVS